jgi:hypothetical protein
MKKYLPLLLFAIALLGITTSCNDQETYAEQKEYENSRINAYIAKHNINPISEELFHSQGDSTSVEKNEYVLFANSGIYMQIVEKGCGQKLKNGESGDVLCRYSEWNINGDSLQTFNDGTFSKTLSYDKFTVRNVSGSFTATFVFGVMANTYGSTQVPTGWLVPLTYINLGRPENENEKIARVKIIVPHNQGQAYATSNVYACFYDITYQRGL